MILRICNLIVVILILCGRSINVAAQADVSIECLVYTDCTVHEDVRAVNLSITNTGNVSISGQLSALDGTAVVNTNFAPLTNTQITSLAVGAQTLRNIIIYYDGVPTGDLNLIVTFTQDITMVDLDSTLMTIKNIDSRVAIACGSNCMVPEHAGGLTVTVTNVAASGTAVGALQTVDVTAVNGQNYGSINVPLTLTPGESTSVTIPILYHGVTTGDLQFYVKFVPNDPNVFEESVTVTILDVPPVVTATDYTVLENETTLPVNFTNVSPVTANGTFTTYDGTAVAGTNYDSVSEFQSFGGQTTVNVPILRDNVPTNDLTFTVVFRTEEGIDIATSVVTIQNVDTKVSVTCDSPHTDCTIPEDESPLAVTVTNVSPFQATGNLTTVDITAVAGVNYQLTSEPMTLAAGDSRTVTIPIENVSSNDGDLQFRLDFVPTGTEEIASQTITIIDVPRECPEGQVYSPCGIACPLTCETIDSGPCELPCVSGCFCPEGTVLYNDSCIITSECSCVRDDGTVTPNGSLYYDIVGNGEECSICTCASPDITCSTQTPCRSATCLVCGGVNYRTFDGKRFKFAGRCSYILAQDLIERNFKISAKNVPCGRTCRRRPMSRLLTCRPRLCLGIVTIELLKSSTVVKMTKDFRLSVNGTRAGLPLDLRPALLLERVSRRKVKATLIDGVMLVFDGRQVAITVISVMRTQGLCGNFDFLRGNDYQLHNGTVVTDANVFGNSWAVNGCA